MRMTVSGPAAQSGHRGQKGCRAAGRDADVCCPRALLGAPVVHLCLVCVQLPVAAQQLKEQRPEP